MAGGGGGGASPWTASHRYGFDLNGYAVVRGVLDAEEVSAAVAACEARDFAAREEPALRLAGGAPALSGTGAPREDAAGFLAWDDAGGAALRSVLAHPRLILALNDLVGLGYRLDHAPLLIQQRTGAEGFVLHGGATADDGSHNVELAYDFRNGTMRNALLGVSVALNDVDEGDGGFCIVRGSHKANLPCPADIKTCADMEHVYNPPLRAGDVLLFTEAATHGTLPWTAERTRRAALFRFAPATLAYGRAYHPDWPENVTALLSPEQAAVCLPPFHPRLDRPALAVGADGTSVEIVTPQPRAPEKVAFDAKVFASRYF